MAELRTDAAASAAKWLTIVKWDSLEACLADLASRSRRIIATALSDRGVPQWDADFAVPCAIAVGNEHDGLSRALLAAADQIVTIPMRGMVQSLNVSVAAAVVLEEALRQRMTK
jgi:tRNA (guanosine-2'-O-)-methyltransferase